MRLILSSICKILLKINIETLEDKTREDVKREKARKRSIKYEDRIKDRLNRKIL